MLVSFDWSVRGTLTLRKGLNSRKCTERTGGSEDFRSCQSRGFGHANIKVSLDRGGGALAVRRDRPDVRGSTDLCQTSYGRQSGWYSGDSQSRFHLLDRPAAY